MPVSLLTLPYELREQVLTTLLSHKSNIRLQHPIESRAVFTSPITQVCKALREEAIRVFYQANAFTWTIDPEAIDLPNPTTPHPPQPSNQQPPASRHESLPTTRTKSLPSALLHLKPALFQLLRHLRLDISLPNPYSRKLWQTTFATQLSTFVLAIDEGVRLRSFRVLISSWHYFREVCEWQTAVLVEGLGQMEVKGNVEVRGRGFGSEVVGMFREVGLGEMVTREDGGGGGGGRGCCREVSEVVFCGDGGEDLDWEWEGGVVL